MVIFNNTKAEFINLIFAGISIIQINYILTKLGFWQLKLLIIFIDSKNVMAIALNPLNAARTRYIDARYKWIIDRVIKGFFKILYICTDKIAVNGFIKLL